MTQKKGLVIDRTKSGIQRLRIHEQTLNEYLATLHKSKGGWLDFLLIPHDHQTEDRPTHKLVLDTPQHLPQETKIVNTIETKAA